MREMDAKVGWVAEERIRRMIRLRTVTHVLLANIARVTRTRLRFPLLIKLAVTN